MRVARGGGRTPAAQLDGSTSVPFLLQYLAAYLSDEPCAVSYKDKKGKYQAQRGVTLPKI